jgi:hypothetical protein
MVYELANVPNQISQIIPNGSTAGEHTNYQENYIYQF